MTWLSDRWRAWLLHFVRNWAVVVLLGTLALLGVAKIGEDVFSHETTSFDGAVQAWVASHQSTLLQRFFIVVTYVGGPFPVSMLAVAAALYLWQRHRRRVAAGVLLAPIMATALYNIVKRIYARPRPIGLGRLVPSSYSFPSGHATAAAAVFCTVAYVFWREAFIGPRTAIAIAVIGPLLIGISRVYLNVHWATDVLGGWSAGLLIAVLASVFYQRERLRHGDSVASSATPSSHLTRE